MKSKERQQFWRQHIETWQASGLSGAAFCKQYDLNYSQFNYWRKKLQTGKAVEKPAGFAQVTQLAVLPSRLNDGLNIHLPCGIRFTGVNTGNIDVVLAILRQL